MRGTRALLALVIAMGMLIIAGTTGLVVVVVHRLTHPHPVIASGAGQAALVREPAATRITSLVRQSDTLLAIALTGGGPDRVVVWDLSSGKALMEIRPGG